MIQKGFVHYALLYSLLAAFIALAGILVASPSLPQWGERHTGDIKNGTLQLRADNRHEQTFVWEHETLDTVVLWLHSDPPLPTDGGLLLEVENPHGIRQASTVAFADIPPSRLAVFTISPPLHATPGEKSAFKISLHKTSQPVRLIYQPDPGKYPAGALTATLGDLAFQLRYQRPALSTHRQQALAALVLVSAGLVAAWVVTKSLLSPRRPSFTVKEWGMSFLIGATVSILYVFWLWYPGWWLGPGDFVKDVSYLQASTQAVRAGEWPIWTPLLCGGMPLLGNPESNSLSLATLLTSFLPAERALWLTLALEAGVCAAGTYLLARTLKNSQWAALLAAGIVSLSPAYAYRLMEGFSMTGGAVAALPWVLLGLMRALATKQLGWLWVGGTALGAAFLRGEVHILIGLVIAAAVTALVWSYQQKSFQPLGYLGALLAISLLWGTPKLLAYFEQPTFFATKLPPYVAPLAQNYLLDDVFLHPHHRDYKVPVLHGEYTEHWGNFGSYVGLGALILGLFGLLRHSPHRTWLIVSTLIIFIISEGTLYQLWLRHLGPLGVLLRLPSRLLSVFILFVSLLSAGGLDWLRARLRSPYRAVLTASILSLVFIDILTVTNGVFADSLWPRTKVTGPNPSEVQQAAHVNAFTAEADTRHAGILLRAGFLLPQLCADLNTPPAFADDLNLTQPLATVPAAVAANTIQLKPGGGPQDIFVNQRFASAWIAEHDATVMAGANDRLQVIVPRDPPVSITLRYLSSTTRVQQWLLTLMIAVSVGLTIHAGWSWLKRSRGTRSRLAKPIPPIPRAQK